MSPNCSYCSHTDDQYSCKIFGEHNGDDDYGDYNDDDGNDGDDRDGDGNGVDMMTVIVMIMKMVLTLPIS